eukprot:XP_011602977.1 PREDICTED: rho guanine nucleotide exchange factor 28-like isoform X2 [Takifugu rubripes]
MELDRREVPLYGQVEASVSLETVAPEAAEFYVVVRGSTLTHITTAKRDTDGLSLRFTVPGHALSEVAAVTSYYYSQEQVQLCQGETSLEYRRDVAQEVAECLSAAREQLGPRSYWEALKRFSTSTAGEALGTGRFGCSEVDAQLGSSAEAELRHLDEKITYAVANLDYPRQWKNTDSRPREEAADLQAKESLLHLAVCLRWSYLSRYLVHQTGGRTRRSSPDEEGGGSPLLPQGDGQKVLFSPPDSAVGPLPGVWHVWSDSSSVLTFCPKADSLTLTVREPLGSCPQEAIMVLRDRLGDQDVLKQICVLKALPDGKSNDDIFQINKGIARELQADEQALLDSVFEEQLVLSLDEDEDDGDITDYSSVSVNGHRMQSRGVQPHILQCPADSRPCATTSDHATCGEENQVDDADSQCSISGVTVDSTETEGVIMDAVDTEDLLLVNDTPLHHLEDSHPPSAPCTPPLSPADRALARLHHSASSECNSLRGSPPPDSCDLSPSSVALEMDSEDEISETKSPISLFSCDGRREDSMDSCHPSPDLAFPPSQSAVSACESGAKEEADQGMRLRSYSYSSAKIGVHPARLVQESRGSDNSAEQRPSTISEQSHDKREIMFRKRAQSADDEGSMELPESLQHLTLSEFLKEIEEEDSDKYNIPAKVESEKYRVIRTFSFLKSRMSSTRNKSKGKGKEREAKERQQNGHRFSAGSCLGPTICVVCDKPASGKDLLHCSSCTAIVHKCCKDSLPPCMKKLQDKCAATVAKSRTASLPQNFTVRDNSPQRAIPTDSLPTVSPKERKDPMTNSSSATGGFSHSDSRLSESPETEPDVPKVSSRSEERLLTPVSSVPAESFFGDETVDACINRDMSMDAVDYEAESWSLTVEHKFCKTQDKRAVKRQDVIYELMQTELHHLQTLHIMAEVFRRGMKEEVQLDSEAVERVFPCLDQLLVFHHAFFAAMKERRHNSAQPPGHGNYLIQQIGDVLLQQFSEENQEKMKQVYGEFCSRHNEAVSFFKELQQHNKRFQNFIKQQGTNSLVRRREIPECILLVTQRITKYPVLLERILQYTEEETEEHADLSKALAQIREVIAAVDLSVSEYERHQRLQEVWNRMENRSVAKLKNGYTFRKQDMMGPGQMLKHQGLLLWKTATGRLKDVLALLLTDSLIFLQEKDQRYTFATVDQKPPVIALQKLIVREVANEERGLFLISASAAGPEMYEVHTSSKEERNAWMRLIREAVESCPEEEEEYTSESEEEKRAAEARVQKIQKLQDNLISRDQLICSSLEEKLQVFATLSALSGRTDALPMDPRLLVQPHSEDVPQAAVLLAAALQEAKNLKAMLSSPACSTPSSLTPDSDTDSEFPSSLVALMQTSSDSETSPESTEAGEGSELHTLHPPLLQKTDAKNVDLKVVQSVQNLTQLLYSLQARVSLQDSYYDIQRLLLQESGRPSPRAHRPHLLSIRGNTLQEQEKQRNLEKQKEEVAMIQRLQDQLRQEKERWERECQARDSQQGERERRLEERERQCHLEAEKLRRERDDLDEQLEEYQQGLERLREGQRNIERERERLESQEKLLQTWRYSRQRSLPAVIPHMLIPLDGEQNPSSDRSRDCSSTCSLFVNEAAFASASTNNRHVHHKRNDPSAHNCLNTLLARSNSRRSPTAKTPESPHSDPQGWLTGKLELQQPSSDHIGRSYVAEAWSQTARQADPCPSPPHHSDPGLNLDTLVSLETDSSSEEGIEETIVYL